MKTNEYQTPLSFIDLESQQKLIRKNIDKAIEKVLDHGQYIMGPEVKVFEKKLEEFTGAKYALSCANGTDALSLVLMAWGVKKNDAIFVPSFTYVASAEAPAQLGATPFFVDVLEDTYNIDPESFKKAILEAKSIGFTPKAVVAVDLFGQPAAIDTIIDIANEENIKVLVDGAQSFGASHSNRVVGSMGHATTTSFFPAKPLGCYGDGGAVFTDSEEDAELINSLRLHGKGSQKYDNVRVGLNSRLDTIQAAILIEKLKLFPKELKLRDEVARSYNSLISDYIDTPKISSNIKSAWAQYTVKTKRRDFIQAKLRENSIPSIVYYPIPLHKQLGYNKFPVVSSGLPVSDQLSKSVLSLPMHPYLSYEKIERISSIIISNS